VRLVVTEGKTVSEVAGNLGIARSLLQRLVEQHTDHDRDGKPRRIGGLKGTGILARAGLGVVEVPWLWRRRRGRGLEGPGYKWSEETEPVARLG